MPSSIIEKLLKILKLEAELGYENKAVVGGLDKYIPTWVSESQAADIDNAIIQDVSTRLTAYRQLDVNQRPPELKTIQDLVRSAAATYKGRPLRPPQEAQPQVPAPTRPPRPVQAHPIEEHRAPRPPAPVPQATPLPPQPRPVEAAPQVQAALNAPLTVLNGIGPKNAELLESINLRTLEDLLYYFPRRYDDYSQLKTINHLKFGEELTIIGQVQSIANRPVRGGKLQITEAVITDGTGFLRVSWFNQPWISSRIPENTQIVLSGKVEMYLGRLVMNSPDWEFLEQEHLHTNRIVPVYSLSGRITQRQLRKMMHQTVNFWAPRAQDYLPEDIRRSAELQDLGNALVQVHFPTNQAMLQSARARLAFDEIFLLQLGVLRQKRAWQEGTAQVFTVDEEWHQQRIAQLPFQLTSAQVKVLQEVRQDLASGRPMNRLLQGDVGSGKTVIAALGIATVVANHAQAALMAPTSILAEQHFRSLSTLLTSLEVLQPGEVRLLIGDTPEAEKAEIRAGLADGTIRLVIGTHALLEDPVCFQRLQLAVIDEQHRFGVAQRALLRAKGENPHLLVMTATPIPRSLALTIYGDLDLSVMDEMPVGRLPVETHALHPLERERAYQLIKTQADAGWQAFIIYPLVEKGENDEAKAAVEEFVRLKTDIFSRYKLGLVHGRLPPDEKEAVMRQFRDGEFQILVATSVVEVGVDIANATVMLIEGANRFGLSQLHQFRGRVGRGADQSYCLMISETEDSLENERLAAMEETTDGFVLAEKDLQQRGPGDFLGTRQSGFAELQMASLTDIRLIEKARQQAITFFERDPAFTQPENQPLFHKFESFWGIGRGDIS